MHEDMEISGFICWSDSMISLAWIKAVKQEFKMFVENRVIYIRKHVSPEKWFYCRSEENPADVITRFYTHDARKDELFYNGPLFLRNYSESINSELCNTELGDSLSAEYDAEKSKHVLVVHVQELCNISEVINISNFSDLNRLSYVLCVPIYNLKRKTWQQKLVLYRYITTEEMNTSRKLWIKANQESLKASENFVSLKEQLNLFEDEQDVLRAKGRIDNSSLPYEAKNPIILDRNHGLTRLIVLDCHGNVKHNGARHTLTAVRANYWITRGKSFIKSILNKCITCRRYNSRPYSYPKTPGLPQIRLCEDTPSV